MRFAIRILRPLVAALALAGAGCSGSSSEEEFFPDGTISVGQSGDEDFDSIQDAVDAASDGDRIDIGPGTYRERVEIDGKSLLLVGSGAATIVEQEGSGVPDPDDVGGSTPATLEVRDATGVTIRGLTVRGPHDGISVRESRDVVLEAIVSSGNGDEGIDIRNSQDVEVTGTFDLNGDEGVQVRDGSVGVVVRDSSASDNVQDGVKVRDSSDCIVRGNVVTLNNDDGILVSDSTGIQVLSNTVTENVGYGIRVRNAPDTLLDANSVADNGEGNIQID